MSAPRLCVFLAYALFCVPPLLAQPAAPPAGDAAYQDAMPIERHALVIGVEKYLNHDTVNHALADADAMAQALSQAGFVPLVLPNPRTKGEIEDAVAVIAARAGNRPATIVFYFAGHGFQFDKTNYLVPAEAGKPVPGSRGKPSDKRPLVESSIDIDRIVSGLGRTRTAGVTLLLLDACRSHILGTDRVDPELEEKGFTHFVRSKNAYLSFATKADEVAWNGKAKEPNSPYAAALSYFIPIESLMLTQDVMPRVTSWVKRGTEEKQEPESLNPESAGYFYFRRTAESRKKELDFWNRTRQRSSRKCANTFLDLYRDGEYAQQALRFIERANASNVDPAPEPECRDL